jgi:ubiquinol-cytochrome c reductase cytochrome b subunit
MARLDHPAIEAGPATDADGIPAPAAGVNKVRARLSRFWYADRLPKPSAEEYAELTSGHGDDGHH